MWIYTNKGFVSIVRHRDMPDHFMVRARKKSHLRAFFAPAYTTIKYQKTPSADYKWRTVVPISVVGPVLLNHLEKIDYPDFKSSIKERGYKDACSGCWQYMYDFQTFAPGD